LIQLPPSALPLSSHTVQTPVTVPQKGCYRAVALARARAWCELNYQFLAADRTNASDRLNGFELMGVTRYWNYCDWGLAGLILGASLLPLCRFVW